MQQYIEIFNSEAVQDLNTGEPFTFSILHNDKYYFEDENYISFLLDVYMYTTGLHGTSGYIPITYSKRSKKLVSLKEAMHPERADYLTVISNEARRQFADLKKQELLYGQFDEDFIKWITEPVEANFAIFTLEKNAVRIFLIYIS